MEEFQNIANKIESKLGETIVRGQWSATLLSIVEKNSKYIKISVRFTNGDFLFERDLKIVAEHYTKDTKFNTEIVRLLKRLNDYSDTVNQISTISSPPNITNRWKGYLTKVEVVNPIESILTFTFSRNLSGELLTFDKQFNINAESFISRQYIFDEIDRKVELLNTPLSVDFYKNLI